MQSILYVGASSDNSHPSDRRGFPEYAIRHNLEYEFGKVIDKKYDLLIIFITPYNSQIIYEIVSKKLKEKYNFKIFTIFTDFYLSENNFTFAFLQKIYRYLFYKKCLDFKKLIISILKESDFIITGSEFQRNKLCSLINLNKNSKINVIPDYIEKNFISNNIKEEDFDLQNVDIRDSSYGIWEGIGEGAILPLIQIMILLISLKFKKKNPKLFFITDNKISFMGRIYLNSKVVFKLINLLLPNLIFIEWTQANLIKYAKKSNFGIITINFLDSRSKYKPANKPKLLLALGINHLFLPSIPDYRKFASNYSNISVFSNLKNLIRQVTEYLRKNNREEISIFNCEAHNHSVSDYWKSIIF